MICIHQLETPKFDHTYLFSCALENIYDIYAFTKFTVAM